MASQLERARKIGIFENTASRTIEEYGPEAFEALLVIKEKQYAARDHVRAFDKVNKDLLVAFRHTLAQVRTKIEVYNGENDTDLYLNADGYVVRPERKRRTQTCTPRIYNTKDAVSIPRGGIKSTPWIRFSKQANGATLLVFSQASYTLLGQPERLCMYRERGSNTITLRPAQGNETRPISPMYNVGGNRAITISTVIQFEFEIDPNSLHTQRRDVVIVNRESLSFEL